jgi:hypothetical protein
MTKIILSALVVALLNLYGIEDSIGASNFVVSADTVSNQTAQSRQDYPVRGEIRQTYNLAPGANVEVSGIEGSVDVQTTSGETAEIYWVRQAKTQNDFDCETIVVENSSNSLIVRHETKKDKQCEVIQAKEHMKLLLPRSANLNFGDIEGGITAGATDGFLQIKDIEGAVRIERAQSAEINSVEGNLSLNIAQVSQRGINIDDIEGGVELGIEKNLNADLIRGNGLENVQIDVPNIQKKGFSRKNPRLQIGAGGAEISISNVDGSVKVRGF